MEWLNCAKIRLVLVAFVVAIVLSGGNAKADFTFGEPKILENPVNSTGIEYFNCISSDGLEIYIESPIPIDDIRSLDWDLYVSTRTTTNDPWSVPVNLGPAVNSSYIDGDACLSSSGLELYFASRRSNGYGNQDIWVTRRPTKEADWGIPQNLGTTINTSGNDMTPWITRDGLDLYFSSHRSDGYGDWDILVSKRSSINDPWQIPENLGPVVNSAAGEYYPCLSPDGLVLFFSGFDFIGDNGDDSEAGPWRLGGRGRSDMWMTWRKSTADPWCPPINLGPEMNTVYYDCQPRISPDGYTLLFTSKRSGGYGMQDIWQAPIIPIVDIDCDGIVNAADMCIVVECWGTDEPLCDIGPMPWGDGVVDVQDLIVLAEHLFEEIPPADSNL